MEQVNKLLKLYGTEKIERLLAVIKLNELINKKEEKKPQSKALTIFLWVFAVIGVIACIAAIVYGIYSLVNRPYLEYVEDCDYDEDDEDGFIGE